METFALETISIFTSNAVDRADWFALIGANKKAHESRPEPGIGHCIIVLQHAISFVQVEITIFFFDELKREIENEQIVHRASSWSMH